MRLRFLFFLFLPALISVTSCTLEKQHYSRGFYVEWKNGNAISSGTSSHPSVVSTLPVLPAKLKTQHSQHTNKMECVIQPRKVSIAEKKTARITENISPASAHLCIPKSKLPDNETHANRMATISLVFALAILVGLILSFAFGWGLYIIFLLLSIPALIFSLIGLRQVRKNPDAYDHKWYSWVGVTLSALEVLVLLITVAAFILYFFFS